MPNFHTAHNLDLCSSQLSAGCRGYLHLQSSAVCWRQIWKWEPNSFRLIIIIHSPPDSYIKLWGCWDSFTSSYKKTKSKNFCMILKQLSFYSDVALTLTLCCPSLLKSLQYCSWRHSWAAICILCTDTAAPILFLKKKKVQRVYSFIVVKRSSHLQLSRDCVINSF